MVATVIKDETRTREQTLDVLEQILGRAEAWPVRVRLWDGSEAGTGVRATLVLEHPWSLRSMLWPLNELSLAEAYIYGDANVEGDLEWVFQSFDAIERSGLRDPRRFARLMRSLLSLPSPPVRSGRTPDLDGRRHSKSRDSAAVRYHYDVSNDFYALWLDERRQYSCAYFRSLDEDLDGAQEAKLEHICRKLRLRPGMHLLDIGCGWGGLLEYAVRHYGVDGMGVTLSENQAQAANERLERAGLGHRAHVEIRDYRELEGGFDAIVSVGMVEHVGVGQLGEYFANAASLLRDGGTFLNHGISTAWWNRPSPRRGDFIDRYVFPDGELAPISTVMKSAEEAGFEIRDIESLREHYAHTLRHWTRRLEQQHDKVVAETDEETYRVWRLYMTGAARAFHTNALSVFQALLVKSGRGPSGLPMTREDWYSSSRQSHLPLEEV